MRLAFQLVPGPLSAFGHVDIASILFGTNVGTTHWPYWSFSFEYHPVIGWGTALLSYVAPDLVFIVLAWGLVVAAAAGVVAWLLTRRVGARRTLVFWSLSPQLLLFGGANFDAIAVLCILVAGGLMVTGRRVRTGIAIGAGAATKLFPIVALAPFTVSFWRAGSRRRAATIALATTVTLAVIDAPAVVAPHSLLAAGVTPYQVASWNLDSIWLPFAMALGFALDQASVDRVIVAISAAGMAITYVLAVRSVWRGADPVRLTWVAVCVVLVWTRLYSPQYAIWLLPVFALYVPRPSLLGFMFVGDALAFLTIFGFRASGRELGDPAAAPLLGALIVGVTIRHVALLQLVRIAWRGERPPSPDPVRP